MNELTKLFKPDDITIKLGDETHRLVYDLNAFCQLETIYDNIDSVIQMLLGGTTAVDMSKVTYNGAPANPEEIEVGGVPLTTYIVKSSSKKEAKHSDTRNLLYAGLLHDHAVYDSNEEIVSYDISKSKVSSFVTFKNLREINTKIVTAILRDLLPPNESKNEEALEQEPLHLVETVKAE